EEVGNACLRGAGDTVTGLFAKTVTVIVDVTVGTALLRGWGPFPELGWRGIAYGTAAGYAVGGLIVLLALLRGRGGLKLEAKLFRRDKELLRRILRIGIPGGLD